MLFYAPRHQTVEICRTGHSCAPAVACRLLGAGRRAGPSAWLLWPDVARALPPLSTLRPQSHPPTIHPHMHGCLLSGCREEDRLKRIADEGWDRFAPASNTNKPPAPKDHPSQRGGGS